MAEITVLVVGGTGESYPGDSRTAVSGLLGAVTAELDGRFDCRWVGYPSSYGPIPLRGGESFTRSARAGADNLRQAIVEAAEGGQRFICLLGYSQGAVVVRTALAEFAENPVDGCEIVAAGLVSDPTQPEGAVAGCSGWGVGGDGPDLPDTPVMWIGDPRDAICNASEDSYLRDIADLSVDFSLRDVRGWLSDIWMKLRRNDFQNAGRTTIRPRQWIRDVWRLRTAVREILGYLPALIMWHGVRVVNRAGGRHTSYYTEPLDRRGGLTGCQVLAQWLQVQVTFTTPYTAENHYAA